MNPIAIALIALFILAVVVYLADRPRWHRMAKEMTAENTPEPAKSVEPEVEDTDAPKKHEIVKTWFAQVQSSVYPHYKCKCGYSSWYFSVPEAKTEADDHVRLMNQADKLLERNKGDRAW